ncbi:M15 family metallopeptidase [Brevibacillus massiliensis]|uniref:M15 family metallopeptidase n=1 Tax=Brevibacillus massiliensis TaxID=1118054 RepID=UPI0002DA529D|nr:M15 family metallopeptidase [Brevibacillus massiliensis]
MLDYAIPLEPTTDAIVTPPIVECGEKIVSLSCLSEKIKVYPYYYHHGYEGALPDCFLREGAAGLLLKAAEQLPDGYCFVVLDGWRSYKLQTSIYNRFKHELMRKGWTEGIELKEELTKFVALPSEDPKKPSPHLTGGAVDLTISGPDGWIEMGTSFDDFTSKAMTRYYEEAVDIDEQGEAIRKNRRWLYHLLTGVGFTNYHKEWWHFDYGNPPWAKIKQQTAIYQGVLTLSS